MKKTILLLVIAIIMPVAALAQKDHSKGSRAQWWKEMQEYKHNFIANEIGLSDEQKEKFFSVYTEMEKATFQLNKQTRDLEKKVMDNKSASDIEYEKAAEALFELKEKEGAVEKAYFDKFKEILTPKQLFKLKLAERKFTREAMKHHNRMKGKK